MNIQNRDNFFTAGAHAIKKIKIFRSCSKFKIIPQLFSTIEIASVVVTIFGVSFEGRTVVFVAEMSMKMFILASNITPSSKYDRLYSSLQFNISTKA